MGEAISWFLTQGVLGVTTVVFGTMALFLYKENKALTSMLVAKSETSEREGKEAKARVEALLVKMAEKGTRVRRGTVHD